MPAAAPVLPPAPAADPAIWHAWFDGSALPNPGRMGLGFVLLSPDAERHERASLAPERGCNNEAELLALCALLETAHALGARRLCIHGDSDVAVRYVNGIDATAVERLAVLVQRACSLLDGFDEIRLHWVPRHRNAAADTLSRHALGLPAKPAPVPRARRR